MTGDNVDESQKYFKQRSQTQYFLRCSLIFTGHKRRQKLSTRWQDSENKSLLVAGALCQGGKETFASGMCCVNVAYTQLSTLISLSNSDMKIYYM